jgi:senataxin
LVEAFLATRRKPAVAIGAPKSSEPNPPQKILICAPSNAAIDELANRIKERYGKSSASPNPVNVVRVGALPAINISVKDIALDTLVDQKLDATKSDNKDDADNEINKLRAEINTVRELKQKKQEELNSVRGDPQKSLALENEIKSVNARRMNLTQKLDRLKDKQKADSRSLDAARRKYRAEVMSEADIICSTLAGAGHELLGAFDYEMVVIDEAAQAVELSSLIPLKYNCKRCIMVGGQFGGSFSNIVDLFTAL